jgi:hypothetical protein
MKTVILTREPSTMEGTFGKLVVDDKAWFTCERPWLLNDNDVSCIPEGSYTCKWTHSPRLNKETYEVLDVPKRAGIRIHSANYPSELEGCVALGETVATVLGKKGVFQSRDAVGKFNEHMNKEDFTLQIKSEEK